MIQCWQARPVQSKQKFYYWCWLLFHYWLPIQISLSINSDALFAKLSKIPFLKLNYRSGRQVLTFGTRTVNQSKHRFLSCKHEPFFYSTQKLKLHFVYWTIGIEEFFRRILSPTVSLRQESIILSSIAVLPFRITCNFHWLCRNRTIYGCPDLSVCCTSYRNLNKQKRSLGCNASTQGSLAHPSPLSLQRPR